MSNAATVKSRKAGKPAAPAAAAAERVSKKGSQRLVHKRAAVIAQRTKGVPQPQNAQASTTKQETVLTLLSRADGVSIPEMMLATQWQQHSVRGFLAGTVKKKLGFQLTSIKAAGNDRRYRIEVKRAR